MLALNIGEILREFGEILGKYLILDERSMGSIGLTLLLMYQIDTIIIMMV